MDISDIFPLMLAALVLALMHWIDRIEAAVARRQNEAFARQAALQRAEFRYFRTALRPYRTCDAADWTANKRAWRRLCWHTH